MASDQHERHLGSRKGFEERHVKQKHRVRASGSIAYATGYGKLEELREQRDEQRLIREIQGKARDWVVEFLHPFEGLWLTAARDMQGRTYDEAYRLVKACGRGYRIVRVGLKPSGGSKTVEVVRVRWEKK